jgi:hypothetical protein
MLPRAFFNDFLPTFSDLIVKVTAWAFDPSARTYVCSPIMSASLMVPVLVNVRKTSAGTLTSAAPLSTVHGAARRVRRIEPLLMQEQIDPFGM